MSPDSPDSKAQTVYLYDGFGQRVGKETNVPGAAHYYFYGADGRDDLEEDEPGVVTTMTYFNGQMTGRFGIDESDGANDWPSGYQYPFYDHLGTARLEFDFNWQTPVGNGPYTLASTVENHTFVPFGGELSNVSSTNPFKYTGQRRDPETGNDFFGARYYSSNFGRFTSPDPSGLAYADPTNPQSFNLYSYVRNNPLIYTDPSGLDCVYLNDTATGVDASGIDHNSDPAECGSSSGGYWAPGYVPDPSYVLVNPNSDLIQISSFNNGLQYTTVANCTECETRNQDGTPLGFFSETWGYTSDAIGLLQPGTGTASLGSASASAPSNLVPQNPCQYAGRALDPSGYAMAGKQANGNLTNLALDAWKGWPAGHYLDAQPLTGASPRLAAAYGNYVFGVYMQSAGLSLSTALSGANAYAFFRSSYPAGTPMDPTYGSLPAANVANIRNGYNAQASGTTCHK